MRSAVVKTLLVAVLAIALAACASGGGNPNVAATVDGQTIPVSEVEERFEQAKSQPQVAEQLEADETGEFESQVQAQILSQLIFGQILERWADELGVDAAPLEVQSERAALVEQSGGEEAFNEQLEQSGFTDEQLEELLRQRVLQAKIAEEIGGQDAEVTEADVEAFYEQNKDTRFGAQATARHILVEDKAKADKLMAEIEGGADFAELAKEHSTDTGSGAQGGDLGEFGPGQMVPEFDEAVFGAEVGELVGPVQTQFGFHIIEVTGKTEGETLDEARDEIEAELAQTKQGEAVDTALRERMAEADVEVNPRFGEWDPEQGQVVPENPLGDVEETTEGATEGAGIPVPTEEPTE